MIKTKTIATIGPATAQPAALENLIEAGIDCIRLNFSHGQLDDHLAVLQHSRNLAHQLDTGLAVMGDLSGPKIRIGEIGADDVTLAVGDDIIIQKQELVGSAQRISTSLPQIVDESRVGDRFMIDDGNILLTITEKRTDELLCRCDRGGVLSTRKGLNVPDTPLSLPALTDKDHIDLDWAIENELDYVAVSFVRSPEDVLAVKERIKAAGSDIFVIAKIEKPQALQCIDAIIDSADGILVARGDLGVEMDLFEVPLLQKQITRKCQLAGKPVIIATQMLQSMVHAQSPTRAEVSDVANAVLDAADAVMLSAETAVGDFPVDAVRAMNHVARITEPYQHTELDRESLTIEHRELVVTSSLATSVKSLADRLDPPLVAVWTQSGDTARLLSKHRFTQPIVALTDNLRTRNKLALNYGVIPLLISCPEDTIAMLQMLDELMIDNGWASTGQRMVVIAGTDFEHTGANNMLIIHQVGSR